MRIGLVVFIVLIVALLLFNPGMDDFRKYVEEHSEQAVEDQAGSNPLGKMLGGVVGGLAGANVDKLTDYNNYLIFSTFAIDFNGRREGGEWKYLGILGQIIPLEKPKAI